MGRRIPFTTSRSGHAFSSRTTPPPVATPPSKRRLSWSHASSKALLPPVGLASLLAMVKQSLEGHRRCEEKEDAADLDQASWLCAASLGCPPWGRRRRGYAQPLVAATLVASLWPELWIRERWRGREERKRWAAGFGALGLGYTMGHIHSLCHCWANMFFS
jgi:hypothetical protein